MKKSQLMLIKAKMLKITKTIMLHRLAYFSILTSPSLELLQMAWFHASAAKKEFLKLNVHFM